MVFIVVVVVGGGAVEVVVVMYRLRSLSLRPLTSVYYCSLFAPLYDILLIMPRYFILLFSAFFVALHTTHQLLVELSIRSMMIILYYG